MMTPIAPPAFLPCLYVQLYAHNEAAMFDWDAGNQPKIERRYPREEVESVFTDTGRIQRLAYTKDGEERFGTVGRSDAGRLLCVIYTYRGGLIRPTSARPARREERELYEEAHR